MPDADVIIVGFRCAGAPLALALHRAGLKVIALEADAFSTDHPLSTHAIQPFGMRLFDELGLGDLIRDLAPRNEAIRFQTDDDYLQVDLRGTDMDSRSPRRSVLDPALQQAVLDRGVDARDRTRVTDLLTDGDRVVGVRIKTPEGESSLRARVVVGADGSHSTIAKLVDSAAYVESRTPNGMYWSYFEKPSFFDHDSDYDWGACIHMEGREARAIFQTDSDLLLLAGGGIGSQIKTWSRDPKTHLIEHLKRGRLTAPLVENSRMVSRPVGMLSARFFMKQAVGPGWALVGDAGLHMDPTPGQGITDAVRDAIALADAIVEGGEQAMHLYWRQRDVDSIGLYHFADDMGSEDYNNPLTRMAFRRSQQDPQIRDRMLEMMDRRVRPLDVIPPTKMLRFLVAESLSGHLAPWSSLGRSLATALRATRQQAWFDRALDRAKRGELDYAVPKFGQTR
jgi:2-polyprenyl-6-methoxyphenol hydroxylase-like FAD-dependent oxidoreductase